MDPNRGMDWSSPYREKQHWMDDEDADPMDLLQVPDDEIKNSPITKKMREYGFPFPLPECSDSKTANSSSSMNAFQYVDKDNLPCLVKIYGPPESELKLNSVFEFIRVLTFDSELAVEKDDNDELSNSFYDVAKVHLPPNKVPCLHCIIPWNIAVEDILQGSPRMELKSHLVKETREDLLGHLTAVLGSDRLIPGVLQLPEDSHLMVDKTQLESGSLSSIGIENTTLLKNLMEFQKVEYDFQYYKIEMEVDVWLLIFSEGQSNIVPADVLLPFQPPSIESSEITVSQEPEAWIWYLATVRSLPHSIGSEMRKIVDNGSPGNVKFWQNQSVIRTLVNGNGIGEAVCHWNIGK